jgi:hypothetical protein
MAQRIRISDVHSSDAKSDDAHQHQGDPSWFLSQASQFSRDELLASYRKSRNLPDHPRPPKQREAVAGAEYRDLITAHPRPPARFLQMHEVDYSLKEAGSAEQPKPRNDNRRTLSLGQTFILAAAMALVSGATVGFLSSRMNSVTSQLSTLVGSEESRPAAVLAETALAQVEPLGAIAASVPKKPVSTATLRVDDVTGQTKSYIPLSLSAEPGFTGGDIMLKISGLPDSAYLTSGKRHGDEAWSLSLSDLRGLKLVIPEAQVPEIDLAVAAFETRTGELAAPVKTMRVALSDVVVQPASAPPPPQQVTALPQRTAVQVVETTGKDGHPSAIPEPKSMSLALAVAQEKPAAALALKGDDLLRSGKLEAARKAYSEAWAQGAGEGAYGLGRSYDPVVLTSLELEGAGPDAEKAVAWYEAAAKAGVPSASKAIVRLKLKP